MISAKDPSEFGAHS